MGLSNKISCEAGSFSCCHLNPHRCFQSEALRVYFPAPEPWVAPFVLLPRCSFQFISMRLWDLPVHKPQPCLVLKLLPCHESSPPSSPSLPLLPVWVNVSSLTPWLLDFHTVRFSVSFACLFVFVFLLLNLLLSFWLCKEAQCVYLCLHLGQKLANHLFNVPLNLVC